MALIHHYKCSACRQYVPNIADHFKAKHQGEEVSYYGYKTWCTDCKEYTWNWLEHTIKHHNYTNDIVQIKGHYKASSNTVLGEGHVPSGEWVCIAEWIHGETGTISVPYILHTRAFKKYLTSVTGVEVYHNTYRTVFRMRMQHEQLANGLANLNINTTTSVAAARQQPPTTSSAVPRQQPPQNSSGARANKTSSSRASAATQRKATSRAICKPDNFGQLKTRDPSDDENASDCSENINNGLNPNIFSLEDVESYNEQ